MSYSTSIPLSPPLRDLLIGTLHLGVQTCNWGLMTSWCRWLESAIDHLSPLDAEELASEFCDLGQERLEEIRQTLEHPRLQELFSTLIERAPRGRPRLADSDGSWDDSDSSADLSPLRIPPATSLENGVSEGINWLYDTGDPGPLLQTLEEMEQTRDGELIEEALQQLEMLMEGMPPEVQLRCQRLRLELIEPLPPTRRAEGVPRPRRGGLPGSLTAEGVDRLLADPNGLLATPSDALLRQLEDLRLDDDWLRLAEFLLWYPEHREAVRWILTHRLDNGESSLLLRGLVDGINRDRDRQLCLRPSDFGPLPDHPHVQEAVYRSGDLKGWKWLMAVRDPEDTAPPEHLRVYTQYAPPPLMAEIAPILHDYGLLQWSGDRTDHVISQIPLPPPYEEVYRSPGLWAYRTHPLDPGSEDYHPRQLQTERWLTKAGLRD